MAKGRSFFKTIFVLILLVSAAALALSYISIYINPEHFRVPMFFGLYFIPIALLNLALLLVALFCRSKSMLIPFAALLPTLFFADLFVKAGSEETVFEGNNFKILTYNVGRFGAGVEGESFSQTTLRVKNYLKEQDADIICLQEFTIKDTASLATFLPDYPYRACSFFKGDSFFGNVTFSRYPITSYDKISFPRSTNLCLWSDIDVAGVPMRIYNCHLESNSISFTSVIKRLSKKETFSDEFVEVHEKLHETNIRRTKQVESVLESVAACKCKTIICGDFNDTPMSYTYHRLSRNMKDSFVESGSGFSSTYSVLWPLLRIDYILLPETFEASRHEAERVPFSDHYPVSTYIYYDNRK
jgi:Metal-dependent hydrolase